MRTIGIRSPSWARIEFAGDGRRLEGLGDPRVPARGAPGLGRRPDAGRAGRRCVPMERIHPDGFFERVFPDRAEPLPVPASRSRTTRGIRWEFVDPYQFGPGPDRLRPPPAGRGDPLPQLTSGWVPTSATHEGFRGVHFAVWAPNAQRVERGRQLQPLGRPPAPDAEPRRDRHLGALHPRPRARARSTSSRSRAGTTATSSRSPTPTASPPSSGPRPPRSSGTSPSSTGTTRTGWPTRAERQGLDAPIADLRGPPRLLEAEGRGREPLPQLPRAGRRPGRPPRSTPTSPTSS